MGNIQFNNGKILFSAAPAIAMDPACCCEPCVDCAASTPDAVVKVAGGCADGWGHCNGATGNYTFSVYAADADWCRWLLKMVVGINEWWLWFEYNSTVESWVGHIQYMAGGVPPAINLFHGDPITIICSGGELSGTVALPGLALPQCNGCTATVTLL